MSPKSRPLGKSSPRIFQECVRGVWVGATGEGRPGSTHAGAMREPDWARSGLSGRRRSVLDPDLEAFAGLSLASANPRLRSQCPRKAWDLSLPTTSSADGKAASRLVRSAQAAGRVRA